MQKKIKDLTKQEIDRICDENWDGHSGCNNCPLNIFNLDMSDFSARCYADVFSELNNEVEVEDDN